MNKMMQLLMVHVGLVAKVVASVGIAIIAFGLFTNNGAATTVGAVLMIALLAAKR